MPTSFRPYRPEQDYLFPPSAREWLSEGHLAYFISDTVETLNLRAFYARYEGDGRRNQPFEPRMMVKVLLYGYATGCFSSRKIAKRLEEDVAFRFLAAGNLPSHRTVCDFRQEHWEEFGTLFVQVVQIAREAGLIKLGVLAVDGSKVKANASKHKAMSYGRMREESKRLRAEVEGLLDQAKRLDQQEDGLYGEDKRGDELPEELRRRDSRLQKIEEAMRRLEQRQAAEDQEQGRKEDDERKSPRGGRDFKRDFGVPPDRAQDNFTDPQSRVMKTGHGSFDYCYNAQIVVESESQLIVATGLTQNAADSGQLLPMVNTAKENAGLDPQLVLADSGYRSEDNFRRLEEAGIPALVPLGREGKAQSREVAPHLEATRRMTGRFADSANRRLYGRRKAIVEPVFGWVKNVLGFVRFRVRGVRAVSGEWNLLCLALNLKRLQGLLPA